MEEVKKINRLILIGNGFDLAHGMKTNYNDFIVWYFNKVLTLAFNEGEYTDELLNVNASQAEFERLKETGLTSIALFIDHFYEQDLSSINLPNFNHRNFANNFRNPFAITYKSPFFERIVKQCTKSTWLDIENRYFNDLNSLISKAKTDSDIPNRIRALNKAFKCLISNLEEYLTIVDKPVKLLDYQHILYEKFNASEFVDSLKYENSTLGDTLILNFNYTSTVEKYTNRNSPITDIKINYIHGKLNDTNNPLIFGYGDELDTNYLKFEDFASIGQFDFIKSFWYFKTSNYYDLIRFIDSNDYQVFTLGHSCGLSDRTMLNMIFEHENCKSIKIYYHGTTEQNNYTRLTQEISRHFKDKRLMRRRIVSLDRSSPMPQMNYG